MVKLLYSGERYSFQDGAIATVPAYMMKNLRTSGGTSMLEAVQYTGLKLTEEKINFPNYCTAMYFYGDGGDNYGREQEIYEFMESDGTNGYGFGEHMRTAFMLGDESQAQILARSFGDKNVRVGLTYDDLVNEWGNRFSDDIDDFKDRAGLI